MIRSVVLSAAVACAALPGRGEKLHGVDTWAGIRPLPAVVNPVGREPSPYLISLRGEWEFVTQPKPFCRRYRHTKTPFAKYDERIPGQSKSTNDKPWSEGRKMHVPGVWEAQGVGEPGMSTPWDPLWDSSPKKLTHVYMGEGWYRKDVVVPSGWKGRKVWLKVGGVRSQGWFWVNRHPVAWVDNYCGTYKYDITQFVKPGEENRILVCVNNALPSRKGLMSNVHRWGGIYRDVELEATPETRIDDAWVRGDFDRREAEAHVTIGSAVASCRIRFTVEGRSVELPTTRLRQGYDGQAQPPAFAKATAGKSSHAPSPRLRRASPTTFTLRLPLPDLRPWSPEHPNLYWAKIELLDEEGNVVHARRERFGVRKLEVRGDKFYLNGHPYFLRGFGDDSVYPLTGMPPADRETHLAHLRKARAAGFNFVRLHTHCEVPEYFEAADEAGIMIQAELPYYTDVPTEAFSFDPLRDLRELYAHYRRHPSFAVYCGGNEGRLGPYVEKEMYAFVKRNDPDRLVNHQDGDRMLWQERDDDEGSNDVGNSDYDIGPRDVWPRGKFKTGRPFVCHEYLNLCVKQDTRIEPLYTGVWAPPDSRADRLAWLAGRGLDEAWGDALQDAQHALQGVYQKRGIEWARKDPYCCGYCFWTVVDVVVANGTIHSAQGLLDPFWQTKRGGLSLEQFARFNGTSAVLADFAPECPVVSEGDVRKVTFLFANYDGAPKRNVAVRWSLLSGGSPILQGEEPVAEIAEGGARPVAAATLAIPPVAKAVKAVLRAEVDGTANEWDLWVFPKRAKRDGAGIACDAALLPLLAKLYDGVSDAASPEGAKAGVVVAQYGSRTAADALARGRSVLTVAAWDGKPNVSLGWWSMGDQVGTALAKGAPALAGLPHEGVLTPLLFRVVKKGAYELSRGELKVVAPIVVGEGKKDCYLYLGEVESEKGRHMAAFGLDLFSGNPESAALMDGILDALRK